jgi:hypothetical protein
MPDINLNQDGEFDADVAVVSDAPDIYSEKPKNHGSDHLLWTIVKATPKVIVLSVVGAIFLAAMLGVAGVAIIVGLFSLVVLGGSEGWHYLIAFVGMGMMSLILLTWCLATGLIGSVGLRTLERIWREFPPVVKPRVKKRSI